MNQVEEFYVGAEPVQAVVALAREVPELPLLVLVVDDSEDDELVAAMADAEEVPAVGYDGAWTVLDAGEHHHFKFRLVRMADAWERTWTYLDPTREIIDVLTAPEYHVAIMPREFAGDLEDFDPRALAGAVIVKVEIDPVSRDALTHLAGF